MRVVVEHGELLDATECSRCSNDLRLRTVSFFTGKPICKACMDKEALSKQFLINAGQVVEDFRKCGYVPDVTIGFRK